jgi:Asp-tRNA(Asn)/Glu-tRNA(Gln) amidotransferase A subunit family amidase
MRCTVGSPSLISGALHCMPVIVKDKFETKGPQTSNSALAFAGYLAGRRLSGANQASRSYQQESNSTTGKAAGAIVLAKIQHGHCAFSPSELCQMQLGLDEAAWLLQFTLEERKSRA